MMVEHALVDLFPSIECDDADADTFASSWADTLDGLIVDLSGKRLISESVGSDLRERIVHWRDHPDHGAGHSFAVYRGMRRLAEEDNFDIADELLQAAAVLHDLAQMMPLVDLQSGKELDVKGTARTRHAEAMAAAIRFLGPELGMGRDEWNMLSQAILKHDRGYEQRSVDHLSLLGAVLSDADKLFGGGFEESADGLVAMALERNLQSVDRKDGWHTFRSDLSPRQRTEWQYGDRWLSDRLSAVLYDIYGLSFHTSSGTMLAENRRQVFITQVRRVYGDLYEQQARALDVSDNQPVHIVGKDLSAIGMESVTAAVNEALSIVLVLDKRYLCGSFEPKGCMVVVGDAVLDPTVVKYAWNSDGDLDVDGGKERFLRAVDDAIMDYKRYIGAQQ